MKADASGPADPGRAARSGTTGATRDSLARAATAATATDPGPRRGDALRRLWALTTGRMGLVIVGAILIAAAVSLVWTPFDPQRVDVPAAWTPPSWPHVLGTDGTGRDLASILLVGAQTTVVVAVGAGIVATVVGVVLAAVGALTPRWVREGMAVLIDILIAFPVLLIALMLAAVYGKSIGIVIVAVGLGYGVNIARVTRAELRRVLHTDFVLAGRAAGLSPLQNLVVHLLPNVAPVFIVQLSWSMAVAVLAEAGLSYLGVGAPPTAPSWGLLLAQLQQYLSAHPYAVVWPGLAITAAVLGLNLLGDALREATDPTIARGPRATRRAVRRTPEVVS